ncbi:MAG TPA: hypothetical protein VM345_11800 [Acidimicrobiales bacterium]|jgi:hypothetical protein|nr:hypothetical protein [Acidimicrobiales bacterium]
MQIEVAGGFQGPPTMGHGGYVAGLFATRTKGAVQVTLKRPTPLDAPLELVETGDGRLELRHGDEVVSESEPSVLEIDVPAPPTLEAARAAEPGSPSHYDGRGVHPTCFGCGFQREGGLRIAAGPVDVDGVAQVAASWRPSSDYAGPDGVVDPQWVLAALDCPGAFAFIATGTRAGLLGRIVFDQYDDVIAGRDHIVTGWQIGVDGRKMLAGTALFTASGELLAAAKATWFGFPAR